MSTETTKKTVVVVGGGSVGAGIAKSLSAQLDPSKHQLVMVTASEKYVHLPGTIRTVTTAEGELEKRVFIPYGDFLKGKGEIKHGEVASFTARSGGKGTVDLASGESLEYDVLVLATGSKWPGPFELPTGGEKLQSHIDSWRAKIEKAQSIVLVGAGAVGIEFAGEISDFYKGKNVSIVHNGRLPLNDVYPDRLRNGLLTKLQKRNVNVVLNDRLDNYTLSEDGTVTLRSGKALNADLVIPTVGGTPNTAFIKESLGEAVLTASNYVEVLPTFQLPSHANIFAAGDIIEWKEQKQAAKAAGHVSVVVKNVLSALKGQSPSAQYKGSYEIMVITLGREGGAGYFGVLWGLIFGDWFARMLKSRGLMIEMTKGNFGF
ncbi:hypothetical protein D9611_014247 [Ephemerocybe angulata]|uniref:FAD/NAD(P)-binding domain-containing protein n=1 Tax=Ephemerocybe angulata TaxID=980116 RepID=A0A8H5B7R0_9AGAR|nr:hypothetical protein D9611_014247 [Tulosesus angulatus]